MKKELTKQFVNKMSRKIVVFTLIMIIVLVITQSMSPIISNEMALGQMQNSNEMFVAMDAYNKIRPIFSLIYVGIIGWFTVSFPKQKLKLRQTVFCPNL